MTVGTLFTLREGIKTTTVQVQSKTDTVPGVLTMFVDKETYERAGLPGKPYGPKGGRGTKPRWSKY